MASLEQLKHTFFDECSEGMQQIEQGLSDIRDGLGADDTVNAVFRAVHSVKGGAGIFGFDGLVGFAHVFETTLDAVRRGDLAATTDVIDVLLMASDILSDLVQFSRAREAIPDGFGAECQQMLERLIGQDSGGAEEEVAPADFDDIEFVPVMFDAMGDDGDIMRTYEIAFTPQPEMLKNGTDPLLLIRQLRQLGELELQASSEQLPDLASLHPDTPYIAWTGTLRSASSKMQVEEIFEFASDCTVTITEVGGFEAIEAIETVAETVIAAPPLQPLDTSPDLTETMMQPIAIEREETPPPAPAPRPASAPAVEPSEPKAQARAAKPQATTTRIELEKIDRVVNMVGELVIAQAMLGQIVHDLPEGVSDRLSQILDEVVHHTRELKDGLMSMRAQAVGTVFQRMPRLVRETAMKVSKKVRLELSGETTEVDRSIIERLSDPLTHIIRNSVDHGVEAPAARLAAGKSEEGTIRLSAGHRGSRIVIEVSDDGAGINTERVLNKAREKGLVAPDASLTEDEINNLIMMPGFSTAETVSDISGRGVGMDVVRTNIQEIGGRLSLHSVRGKGMTIQFSLPLTLAVMDGMVIKVGR